MIVDLRKRDTEEPIRADVAIVGAGPAGITLALELADAGVEVAILESGGFDLDQATQDLYRGDVIGNEGTDVDWSRLRYFGGTSNHWGGHCLPLDAIDFEKRPGVAESGWPIDRRELDPYYRRAHDYCDLGAFVYSGEEAGVDDVGNPMPLPSDRFSEVLMRMSRGPTRFGEKFQEALADAQNITVYLWANITDIVPNSEGTRIDTLNVQTLSKKEARVDAKNYVLATGGIENARLLLNARTLSERGLGNQNDLVGRYFMDHPQTGLGFMHLTRPLDLRRYIRHVETSDGVDAQFNLRPSDEAMRERELVNATLWLTPVASRDGSLTPEQEGDAALTGMKRIVKKMLGRNEDLGENVCKVAVGIDELAFGMVGDALGRTERTSGLVLVRCESEQTPNPRSRVLLTEDKDALGMNRIALDWQPASSDIEALERMAVLFGEDVAKAGLARFELEDHFATEAAPVRTAWHHIGTTRMAETPRTGVVDTDLKVHGLGNLYVAGSSVFPTAGRSNPTLTLVALSVRLAEKLKAVVRT